MSGTTESGTSEKGWRPSPKLMVAAVVLLLALVFALENTDRTGIHLYFWKFESPLWLWLLIVLLLGVAIGLVLPRGRSKD